MVGADVRVAHALRSSHSPLWEEHRRDAITLKTSCYMIAISVLIDAA